MKQRGTTNILYKYDGSNNITNRYTQNLVVDDPLALQTNEQTYYYLKDALGTVVAITDVNGNIVQNYTYDSYGNIHGQTGYISQPFTFTGREYDDETGLYFYRARMYDAKIGRFISKDPISFAGGDVNLFRMVLNNPVNWIDPTGLAAYMCTKPLDALGGVGQWVYQYGNLYIISIFV